MTTDEEAVPNMPPNISFQFFAGFFQCGQDEYAFPCTKSVGFQYVRGFQGFQEFQPSSNVSPVNVR